MLSVSRQPALRSSARHLRSCIRSLQPAQRIPAFLPWPLTPTVPSSRNIASTAIRSATRTDDVKQQHGSTTTTKKCPHCSSLLPLAASPCPKCSQLVPIPSEVSYYSLFDLTPSPSSSSGAEETGPVSNQERIKRDLQRLEGGGYVLDVRDLRTRFFKRQQGCHPDSFTGQGKVSFRPVLSAMVALQFACIHIFIVDSYLRPTNSHWTNPRSSTKPTRPSRTPSAARSTLYVSPSPSSRPVSHLTPRG